jgi:hypothetical protein
MAKSGRNDARSGRIHARRWCGLASGAHEQGGGDEGILDEERRKGG